MAWTRDSQRDYHRDPGTRFFLCCILWPFYFDIIFIAKGLSAGSIFPHSGMLFFLFIFDAESVRSENFYLGCDRYFLDVWELWSWMTVVIGYDNDGRQRMRMEIIIIIIIIVINFDACHPIVVNIFVLVLFRVRLQIKSTWCNETIVVSVGKG